MSRFTDEVDLDFVPNFKAMGTRVLCKIDKPEELRCDSTSIDPISGLTSGGIYVDPNAIRAETRNRMLRQTIVTIVSRGTGAFMRDGMEDLYAEAVPGARVIIKQFSGENIPNKEGARTLYYWVNEQDFVGLITGE